MYPLKDIPTTSFNHNALKISLTECPKIVHSNNFFERRFYRSLLYNEQYNFNFKIVAITKYHLSVFEGAVVDLYEKKKELYGLLVTY
jgi:hypothetical protein